MFYTRVTIVIIAVFVYLFGIFFTFTETVFRLIVLTGSLSYAGILSGLVGGLYWKRANTRGAYCAFAASAIPPVVSLIVPGIDPTNAGLLSFVLAPLALIIGSVCLKQPEIS